jgi:hypothetical protein
MNIASSWMADGAKIPGHLNAQPIPVAASILPFRCRWQSGRLFDDCEDPPPAPDGDTVGRLHSHRLSIAQGWNSAREQGGAIDAKQLLQFAPSTP